MSVGLWLSVLVVTQLVTSQTSGLTIGQLFLENGDEPVLEKTRNGETNETSTTPEFSDLNFSESNGTGISQNGSRDGSGGTHFMRADDEFYRRRRNKTWIPAEMVLRWFSIVAPFANEMATMPKFPWAVSIQSGRGPSKSHSCSGNILTKIHVLSSCRCLSMPTGSTVMPIIPKHPSSLSIIAGVSMLSIPLKEQLTFGQVREVADVIIHPQCTQSANFDYGVVELEHYLYFSKRVYPMPDPFKTFSSAPGRPEFLQPYEICKAAGWPKKQGFWEGESKGEQKINDFLIVDKNSCSPEVPYSSNQFVCAASVGGDTWKTYTSHPGDVGSGLVCHDRVSAILSFHTREVAVFSSLRPALTFLWEFYQDSNEVYVMNSSSQPSISAILLLLTAIFTILRTL